MTDQERYDKAKQTVERIEKEGIKSWSTSIGYSLNVAEMNKVGPKLGYGVYNDIRKKPLPNAANPVCHPVKESGSI